MGAMASQITGYSTVAQPFVQAGADKKKYQSPASLAIVRRMTGVEECQKNANIFYYFLKIIQHLQG